MMNRVWYDVWELEKGYTSCCKVRSLSKISPERRAFRIRMVGSGAAFIPFSAHLDTTPIKPEA